MRSITWPDGSRLERTPARYCRSFRAYMGHSSIAGTDYYLRLTAESYPHIIARVQRAFGDVVPPLKAGQCDGD